MTGIAQGGELHGALGTGVRSTAVAAKEGATEVGAGGVYVSRGDDAGCEVMLNAGNVVVDFCG